MVLPGSPASDRPALAQSECSDLSLRQAHTGRRAELRSGLSGPENWGFFETAGLRWVLLGRLASRGSFRAPGASPRLWELLVRGEGVGEAVRCCADLWGTLPATQPVSLPLGCLPAGWGVGRARPVLAGVGEPGLRTTGLRDANTVLLYWRPWPFPPNSRSLGDPKCRCFGRRERLPALPRASPALPTPTCHRC